MNEGPDSWDAVFWDIGGAIVDQDSIHEAQRLFIERLVDSTTIATDTESALSTWREELSDYFRARNGREFLSSVGAYQQGIAAIADDPIETEVWWPLFEDAFIEEIRPVSGAIETLERLAKRDLHLGVISDMNNREAETILSTFGVEDLFDSITTSNDVGRMKPEPVIFETALERASISSDYALMIGDRYGHDIRGAAEVGMWTVGYQCQSGPAADAVVEDIRDVLLIVDGELSLTTGMHG